MWLITKDGFYSITDAAAGAPKLTITAMVRDDLVALKRDYIPKLGPIVEMPGSGHHFRAFATRQEVARAVGQMASDINYSNIEDEVALALSGRMLLAFEHRGGVLP